MTLKFEQTMNVKFITYNETVNLDEHSELDVHNGFDYVIQKHAERISISSPVTSSTS